VSRFFGGTSAQLQYTAITLVQAVKYRTEDKLKMTESTQIKYYPEKANNTKHSKTKLPWFGRLLQHSARKWGGLIIQHSTSPHMAKT